MTPPPKASRIESRSAPGEDELVGEGFDGGEALVAFAGGDEEDCRLGVGREASEEGFVPEGPDFGRGDDEGLGRAAGVEFAEARIEGAEKAGRDGDVVAGLRSGDANDGHGGLMVQDEVSGQWC